MSLAVQTFAAGCHRRCAIGREFPEAIRTKVARVLKKEKARGIKQKWRMFWREAIM